MSSVFGRFARGAKGSFCHRETLTGEPALHERCNAMLQTTGGQLCPWRGRRGEDLDFGADGDFLRDISECTSPAFPGVLVVRRFCSGGKGRSFGMLRGVRRDQGRGHGAPDGIALALAPVGRAEAVVGVRGWRFGISSGLPEALGELQTLSLCLMAEADHRDIQLDLAESRKPASVCAMLRRRRLGATRRDPDLLS